ncbi:MAG: 23S rRNA (uracil(747)-C(5))-methyltransferase RlmC [Marmoricola sp.]
MDCHHFDLGECRSCTWLLQPYDGQLAAKQRRVVGLLGARPDLVWAPPFASPQYGFRNKAKMVVSGTTDAPTLGILDEDASGVDLRDCGLHVDAVRDALPVLAEFVTRADLSPYDLGTRRGELKLVLVTAAPTGELMVRFVTRSQEPVARIRKHLAWLLGALPGLRVVTVNLQPEPKAVLEGDTEIVLTGTAVLPVPVNGIDLLLRPQSFFQTNTAVASALYAEAVAWTEELAPRTVWDLYCGVGGFALHLAADGRRVHGIETSTEAVEAARESARRAPGEVTFETGDAAAAFSGTDQDPDLVVVNPPRRGIGPDLAARLDASAVGHVLYSSCNPDSLAADLAAMPSLVPVRGRVFDMFPHTAHAEVLVLLERR